MSIADSLTEKQGLTNAEREVADFVLAHAEEVVRMKIGELADSCFVSKTTVVRLCHKIGFPGYREFRVGLAKELERRRSFPEKSGSVDVAFEDGESPRQVMQGIADITKEAVNSCYSDVTSGSLERAAQLVCKARKVVFFASGDSYVSCGVLLNQLVKIGITSLMGSQLNNALMYAKTLGPKDLAFVVTYSGLLLGGDSGLMEAISRTGCKSVVVTARKDIVRPAYHITCPIVFAHKESLEGRMATFYSQACIRYLLNCVYGMVFAMDYERNMRMLQSVDH